MTLRLTSLNFVHSLRLYITPRAARRAGIVSSWWEANCGGPHNLFQREYEQLLLQLATVTLRSLLGTRYTKGNKANTWRVRLKKSQQYVYYSIDEAADVVEIIMIWGARRGREPKL